MEILRDWITKNKLSLGLLGLTFPFFALSFYNFPAADDFAYADTKIVMGFWAAQLKMYFGWSGRYISTALLSLSPVAFRTLDQYIWLGIFNVFLLGTSLYIFINIIAGKLLTRSQFHILFFGFFAIYLAEMPSPTEGFYWLSGFVTYTWAFSVFLLVLAILCWLRGWGFNRTEIIQTNLQKTFTFVIMILASILLGGFNETLNLIWISCLMLAILYDFLGKREVSHLLIYTLIFAILGLGVSLLAPGNKVREAQLAVEHSFVKTIFRSLGLGIEIFFRYLKIPFILGLLLATPTILSLQPKIEAWFYQRRTRWITAAIFGWMTFIFLAPSQWAMGHSPPRRALNLLCGMHLFFVSIMYCQFVWSRQLQSSGYLKFTESVRLRHFRGRGLIIMLISLLVFGNIGRAWYDLIFKAKTFARENQERITIFKGKPFQDVVIKPYSNPPDTLFFDDVIEDKSDWRNTSLALYFGLKSVRLESSSDSSYHKTETD